METDLLERVRRDFGPPLPLRDLFAAAGEMGLSPWTLLKAARARGHDPRHSTLRKIDEWYERRSRLPS